MKLSDRYTFSNASITPFALLLDCSRVIISDFDTVEGTLLNVKVCESISSIRFTSLSANKSAILSLIMSLLSLILYNFNQHIV